MVDKMQTNKNVAECKQTKFEANNDIQQGFNFITHERLIIWKISKEEFKDSVLSPVYYQNALRII